jgi:E3 ubiquitin-protein ligase SHPRH
VAAQTVFMVEPVFNEALEQQAISRVDRIGQTKETTVFWYIIRDHSSEENEDDEDAASLPLHAALDTLSAGGGEVVSDEDVRRCFTNQRLFAIDELVKGH